MAYRLCKENLRWQDTVLPKNLAQEKAQNPPEEEADSTASSKEDETTSGDANHKFFHNNLPYSWLRGIINGLTIDADDGIYHHLNGRRQYIQFEGDVYQVKEALDETDHLYIVNPNTGMKLFRVSRDSAGHSKKARLLREGPVISRFLLNPERSSLFNSKQC